jgi:hypothetical protein
MNPRRKESSKESGEPYEWFLGVVSADISFADVHKNISILLRQVNCDLPPQGFEEALA